MSPSSARKFAVIPGQGLGRRCRALASLWCFLGSGSHVTAEALLPGVLRVMARFTVFLKSYFYMQITGQCGSDFFAASSCQRNGVQFCLPLLSTHGLRSMGLGMLGALLPALGYEIQPWDHSLNKAFKRRTRVFSAQHPFLKHNWEKSGWYLCRAYWTAGVQGTYAVDSPSWPKPVFIYTTANLQEMGGKYCFFQLWVN
jgi:hypothetical protein